MIGSRLGAYEITAKLGEGGMGEVWRATDTKLKREVAIKVLPAAFTEDAERLARFEREAQLLAQLQHPNIASIYGLEESDGTRALVLELVEGPTLAERLEAGPLPLEECLLIARQILEALIQNCGTIVTYQELTVMLWGNHDMNMKESLAVHVSGLRKKIRHLCADHEYIQSQWGKGYIFIPRKQ